MLRMRAQEGRPYWFAKNRKLTIWRRLRIDHPFRASSRSVVGNDSLRPSISRGRAFRTPLRGVTKPRFARGHSRPCREAFPLASTSESLAGRGSRWPLAPKIRSAYLVPTSSGGRVTRRSDPGRGRRRPRTGRRLHDDVGRGKHRRSARQRGRRLGHGHDRTAARRFARPPASHRVADGACYGARGNDGRVQHPTPGIATSALHLNFAAQGVISIPGTATAMFTIGQAWRAKSRVADRDAPDRDRANAKVA
jgi:hypothetical protein